MDLVRAGIEDWPGRLRATVKAKRGRFELKLYISRVHLVTTKIINKKIYSPLVLCFY